VSIAVEPAEKWVNARPFRTRYLEAGDSRATTVLLLHDGTWGGASSVSWGNLIAALGEQYHVLAPDMLGFGGTDKAVFVDRSQYEARTAHLAAFLDALSITEPVHLAGTSFGGSLALRAISGSPLPVRSVVSICGTGGPWRSERSIAELGHWDGSEEDLRRIVKLLIDESDLFELQLSERLRWAADVGHYRALKAPTVPLPPGLARSRVDDGWPGQLLGTATPVMLIAGQHDVLLEPGWTEHITAVAPHARVETLDCKHSPNIDRPELLLPLLLDFFSQT
jgi:pimeloyl-ACP methyl ester carboxylesterase